MNSLFSQKRWSNDHYQDDIWVIDLCISVVHLNYCNVLLNFGPLCHPPPDGQPQSPRLSTAIQRLVTHPSIQPPSISHLVTYHPKEGHPTSKRYSPNIQRIVTHLPLDGNPTYPVSGMYIVQSVRLRWGGKKMGLGPIWGRK